MNNELTNKNYIIIQGFMVNELKLKGNELLIYAIIFGFSQIHGQSFEGSLQYIADWTSSTKQGVIKSLKSLIEKGYIIKEKNYHNNVKFCKYSVNVESLMVLNSVEQGIKLSLPNNIIKKDDIIINNNIIQRKKRNFTVPTVNEVEIYCKERNNNIDAQSFIDFYESKGWLVGKTPMKDWKAAIRTWENNNKKQTDNNKPTSTLIQEQDGVFSF